MTRGFFLGAPVAERRGRVAADFRDPHERTGTFARDPGCPAASRTLAHDLDQKRL